MNIKHYPYLNGGIFIAAKSNQKGLDNCCLPLSSFDASEARAYIYIMCINDRATFHTWIQLTGLTQSITAVEYSAVLYTCYNSGYEVEVKHSLPFRIRSVWSFQHPVPIITFFVSQLIHSPNPNNSPVVSFSRFLSTVLLLLRTSLHFPLLPPMVFAYI